MATRFGALATIVTWAVVAAPVSVDAQQPQQQPRRQQQQSQQGPLIDYEGVLYSQPRLMDEIFAGILPSEPTRPNNYFLGFSAWSQQDVFIREIAQAREIVDERLGTRDRSVLLINHTMALDEIPIASVTNLEMALVRLGRVMNVQKDTLVLFLTSHGIENMLGVQFPPLPLNHLTPPRLAAMLEKSGIRHRIVIISACHSGSFIPALRHPNTVVMTASRTDRVSFGCTNESEWTYFGNAVFNHGLRKTTSLTEVFDQARVLIGGWEAKDKFQPSEPQLFIGAEAGPMLERLAGLPATSAR